MRKRARCPGKRLVPSSSCLRRRALAVELDADVEPRREHDLGRQGPPGLALELDLDPPARPGAQKANSWRRPSPDNLGLLGAAPPLVRSRRRQQARGGEAALAELGLDPVQDLVGHIWVFTQEGGRVLAPLAEPLLVEAEVRARLLDDLPVEPGLEHRALPGGSPSRR